jgi:plasmid stabilization system protein ParE
MRRLPVELSPEALSDIAEIRAYLLREAGPAVPTRVLARIRKKLAAIERMPDTGAPRPEFGEGMRLHVSGSYIIYVQVGAERVDVVRILHAAQDRDGIMSGRKKP